MSLKLVIQGHPDPLDEHYCHALEQAYVLGAKAVGHEVEVIRVSQLEFSLISSLEEFKTADLPDDIKKAQELIEAASHIEIILPLWLGTMPALLKGFFEQVFRPGFGFDMSNAKKIPKQKLRGKSAHVVVTMDMPAMLYKRYFGAHGIKNLDLNILRFCGFHPVEISYIGSMRNKNEKKRKKWLEKMRLLGQAVI